MVRAASAAGTIGIGGIGTIGITGERPNEADELKPIDQAETNLS
jgi:hypothetical protein